jgi:uncharacterized protein
MSGCCPICDRPRDERYRPFCSKRCADIDLGRWLKGRYAIPATPGLEENEDAPGAGDGVDENSGRNDAYS